jgi:hypothetical protein
VIGFIFNVWEVNERPLVTDIDQQLMLAGWKSKVEKCGTVIIPGKGMHFQYFGKLRFAILYKYRKSQRESFTYSYNIYGFGVSSINSELQKINHVRELWYEPSAFNWQIQNGIPLHVQLPSPEDRHSQKEVIRLIMTDYTKNSKATCFIHGPPGSGKSLTGPYLARELQNCGKNPLVVSGFNAMVRGLTIEALRWGTTPTRDNPVIVMLDEIDKSFAKALDNKESKTETACYAQDKTALCLFLDRLARLENIIVIGTSNEIIGLDHAYSCFIRSGRFDIHYEMR